MLLGKGSYGTVYINRDKTISKHTNLLHGSKLIDSNIREIFIHNVFITIYSDIVNKTISNFTKLKSFISKEDTNWIQINKNTIIINMSNKGNVLNINKQYDINHIYHFVNSIGNLINCFQHIGISHGDIKPSNICFNSDTKVWSLIDYGSICFHISGIKYSKLRCTLFYISPDELIQLDYKKDSDLWSFGVVIFEMLTGKYFLLELLQELNTEQSIIDKFKESIVNKNDSLILVLSSIYKKLTQSDVNSLIEHNVNDTKIKHLLLNLLKISNRGFIKDIISYTDHEAFSIIQKEQSLLANIVDYISIETSISYNKRIEIIDLLYSKCRDTYLFSHSLMLFDRYILRKFGIKVQNANDIAIGCYCISLCIINCCQSHIDISLAVIIDILKTLEYKIYNKPPEDYIYSGNVNYNRLIELYKKYPLCHDTVEQIAKMYL